MVWVPLPTIHGHTNIDQWHHDSPAECPCHPETICIATHATAPKKPFLTRQCWASYGKGVTRQSPHCYYPSLACLILGFVSNRAYLGSFGMASWASYEFERTRRKVTANIEIIQNLYALMIDRIPSCIRV
ncbi:uncharacterized protein TNCV_4432211 [Trichonephila clavipes]|nr:uncharacterized protein TNCV_4432211 [Trichonephila clavipes]